MGSISEEETCEKLKGLIQRQVQMCKRNLEVMDSVRRGAQLAIEECQYQFRNRRWNCSTLDTLPVFGKVVTQGEPGGRVPGVMLRGRGEWLQQQSGGLQVGFACLPLTQQLGRVGNGPVLDLGADESSLGISAGLFGLYWGQHIQTLAVPQLLGASSPEPFSHPAGAHGREAPAQGIQRAGTFYKDMPSSSGGPKVALRSNCRPAKPRSFALQNRGCIYSVSSPGSAEAVIAARLARRSRAEPSAGETLGGQPSAARCE